VWKLFSDRGFQRFVQSKPEFLDLIASPVTSESDRRWAIVTAGLHRAMKAGWISSPLKDDRSILSLAEAIVQVGPTGDFKSLLLQRRKNPDFQALSGLTAAIRHFYSSPLVQVAEPLPNRPQLNYYGVLHTALQSPLLVGQDLAHIEGVVKRIEEAVEDPAERIRRTSIYKHLDLSNAEDLSLWRTVVQAWNVAAQKSLCDADGHISQMRDSPPVGAFVDQLADVMLLPPSRAPESGVKRLLAKFVPEMMFGWDPGQLSWEDLLRITEDNSCRDSCTKLQTALDFGDEYQALEAVKQFGSNLAPLLKGRIKQPVPWWIWALGPIVLKFGVPDVPIWGKANSDIWLQALSVGQFAERSLVWGINKLRDRIIAARVVDSAPVVGRTRD
jgi:hypothetical protein